MSDPFRMYEAARKHMYTAMERESDPPTAIRGYQQALDGFALFLTAAAKNRGMYKELEKKANRMKDTCKNKLQSLQGVAAPPSEHQDAAPSATARPHNGVPHRGRLDDSVDDDGSAPPPRRPSRGPVRAPSPSPSLRAPSPSQSSARAPSPQLKAGSRPGSRQPSPAPIRAAASSRAATPSTAGSRSNSRRRFVAASDSDSDSDRERRERIRRSVAKALSPPKVSAIASTPAGTAPNKRASFGSGRPSDRRRMRLDSDSDEDDNYAPARPRNGPSQTPQAQHKHQTPNPRTGPKPSTPAAKPRASRAGVVQPGSAVHLGTPADARSAQPRHTAAGKDANGTPQTAVPPRDAPPRPPSSVPTRQSTTLGGDDQSSTASVPAPDGTLGRRVASPQSSQVLRVRRGCRDGSAFGSIVAALEAADNGSTVEVEEGEYTEQLVLSKSVTLKGLGDGVVLKSAGGHTLIACSSEHVQVIGIKLVQTGGDSSKRGRSSARCVEVFSGQMLLERCTLQSEAGSGVIVADGGTATVNECIMRSCGKCGLLVFDGGNIFCNDSVISGNGLYGMVVQNGGTATVEGNRFASNKHAGILVHGRASVCTVRANDISTNGEMGVGVQSGAEVRLERNRITGNVHAGLFVDGDGSRAAVRDCEMLRNGVRGIGVQTGAEVHVQGCSVSNNSQEGLFVSGSRSRATLQDNDLSENGTKGVGIQSAAVAIIISNRIVRNLEEGVFVSDQGSQATIRDNNVVENGMKGVGVQSCGQADIDGNLIHNNHREGVYVSGDGSKALIQNNDVTENGVKGVGIQDGADVAVEGNRISGNQYVGVHVYGERSRGIVRENDIRDNSLAAVVTENGGIVQSADNRIDGVHESQLAIPHRDDYATNEMAMPEGGDVSFRGREHDATVHSPSTSAGMAGTGGGSSSAMSNAVQVEVVGATDLPKVDGFGLSNPFVCISLFGVSAGPSRAIMSSHDTYKAQVSTTVKRQTLNPSWSERFALDRLHPEASSKVRQEGLHGDLQVLFTVHDGSSTGGEESRIGGAVVEVKACSRTEHWLPLMDRQGDPLQGRGGKPAMLHVYISYGSVALSSAASPVLAAHRTPGGDAAHKPPPGRPSETHDIAMNDAGAVDGGELVSRENCRIGEKLWVIEDAAEVRRLTDKSSGISWNEDMADCCGTQGEVVAVLDKYVGMRFQGYVSWCFVYGALRRR